MSSQLLAHQSSRSPIWVALVTLSGDGASAAAGRQICRGGGVEVSGNQPMWGWSSMSHPVQLDALVREHQADLLRTAEAHRLARSHRRSAPARPARSPRRLPCLRARTGWALVELGLRIAVRADRGQA